MGHVLIIGGGAAGMMAAIWAANNHNEVSLYEKNDRLGKKLFITGKGRCNLTNACDIDKLFDSIVTNKKFMYSAIYGFDNISTLSFFEGLGLDYKVERGDRVFPTSDHSSDVIQALVRKLERLDVEVNKNTKVTDLIIENDCVKGIVIDQKKKIYGDSVIIATGGKSYPLTGSTGDGYTFAKMAGHSITELTPSLVPFEIKEPYVKDLMGLSLKNTGIHITADGKTIYKDFGEMLFTHFGVSGPMIISASAYVRKYMGKELKLYIDLKPALSKEKLDERLLRDFEKNNNKHFSNALDELLPKKLIPIIIANSGISSDKKVCEISKASREKLNDCLKNMELTITGLRNFNEAIITQGGVNVKEIDPSTMESKITKNLFFAGEVLDVDALTGGFNLQIAWSSAYLAGNSLG